MVLKNSVNTNSKEIEVGLTGPFVLGLIGGIICLIAALIRLLILSGPLKLLTITILYIRPLEIPFPGNLVWIPILLLNGIAAMMILSAVFIKMEKGRGWSVSLIVLSILSVLFSLGAIVGPVLALIGGIWAYKRFGNK
tara:strand:- start:69 stop:482 length:414 start_codon:yes stop_codon:yes gene_type:complete